MTNEIREETRSGGRAAPRTRRRLQAGAIVALLGGWTVSALAHIVNVGGDAILFTPNSVEQDQNESDTDISSFDEKQCFTLKDDLVTDQGVIPAGTSVSCHMMQADPASPPQVYQGTAVFDGQVLGVISDSAGLEATDDLCGLGTVDYPDPPPLGDFRGLEAAQPNDDYRRVMGGCGLQVKMDVPSFQDQIRIITECCDGEDCCG